jgi:hypothetical protein
MTEPSHRRDFVRALAIGGAATAIGRPAPAMADDEPKKDEPPKVRSEVDARMDMVLARHGKYLDEAARKSVRDEVESIVRRGEQLRKFALTNGDEPFPVFTPYRAPLA